MAGALEVNIDSFESCLEPCRSVSVGALHPSEGPFTVPGVETGEKCTCFHKEVPGLGVSLTLRPWVSALPPCDGADPASCHARLQVPLALPDPSSASELFPEVPVSCFLAGRGGLAHGGLAPGL